MTTLALGIDAGSTRSGFACVRLDPDGWLHIDHGAHLDNGTDAVRWMITNTIQRLGVVAMETICGYAYEAKRVQALVETARFEGRMLELCRLLDTAENRKERNGRPIVVSFGAREVRGELCRSATASDEQVRIVIEALTKTRPALNADARPHVYDAAASAVLAIMRGTGRKLQLPAGVEAALHLQRERERAGRATKRQAVALGAAAPPEKRSPTRAQTKRRSDAATKAARERIGS